MKKNKRMKKRLFLIAALVFLVVAAVYTVWIQPMMQKETAVYKEETVERGSLKTGVTESGFLDYGIISQLYDLNLTISENDENDDEDDEETVQKYLKVEEVYVAAGQRVTEGDQLIKFTEDSVSDVRRLLKNALADAEVAYAEAQSEYTLSLLQAQLTYEQDLTVRKYAESVYANSKQAVTDQISQIEIEIAQLGDKRDSLQENYDSAVENCQDALESFETAKKDMENVGTGNIHVSISFFNKYVSAQSRYQSALSQKEQAAQRIEDNEAQIEELERQLTQLTARKQIDVLGVEQDYENDVLTGETAQIAYNSEVAALKEELEEAREEYEQISEQMAAFEEFVGEDGTVYAQGSGILTEVGYQEGDVLSETGTIIAYAPAEDMTITVDVSQEDIVALAVGDSVEIEFAAYDGEIWQGTVTSIVTTETAEGSATVSYPVTIGVLGDTTRLYGGMTADVTFVTDSRESVIYVSRKAIVEQNGKTYVYKAGTLGQKELQEVETGLSNGVYVEILSGLEEGDKIYVVSQTGGSK